MTGTPASPIKPAMGKPDIGERELVVMMAMLQALQALAIDAMLPAMGAIARDLNLADDNQRQLVIGIFLLGIGIGSLLPGALADRYGRRPVLFGCLAFYIITMLACVVVRDFMALVILRGLQGVGCAGLAVVPQAIIRDRFEGDRMARLQSMIGMVFMLVPMAAPSLGQLVMDQLGWRAIFGMMLILGLAMSFWIWVRLPETLQPDYRQPVRMAAIASNMTAVFKTREAIGYVIASALMLSAGWGFINSSQQLIAEHFGAGSRFPLLFAAIALCMAAANFINSRIVVRFGTRRVSHTAMLAYIVAAAMQLYFAMQPHQTLAQFMIVLCINMALVGFIGANFGAIAMQPFARAAGSASSTQVFLRTVIAAVLGGLIGQAYDGTARPLAIALTIAGLSALALVLFSERGVLFRRLNPPVAAE